MLTIPNMISLLRIPLALAFLQQNMMYRVAAIVLAMLSDALDGYFARRYGQSSKIGTLLDPLMDKFFVFFALSVLMRENRLELWQAATMICRDFSVIVFGVYLAWRGKLGSYRFRAILCGKITTAFQLIILLGLVCHITFPPYVFMSFIILGLLALAELYVKRTDKHRQDVNC